MKHEFTEREKKYLIANFKEFPYLARDEEGNLHAYSHKPTRHNNFWTTYQWGSKGRTMKNVREHFQTIQWENEEPCKWEDWV